jgi:hypothetical protein
VRRSSASFETSLSKRWGKRAMTGNDINVFAVMGGHSSEVRPEGSAASFIRKHNRGLLSFWRWLRRRQALRRRLTKRAVFHVGDAAPREGDAGQMRDGGLPFFVTGNPFCMSSQVSWLSHGKLRSTEDPTDPTISS